MLRCLLRQPPLLARAAGVKATPVRWNQQAAAESHLLDEHDALRRRLLYRSKQRGWLEMDIMLGDWARNNLPSLGGAELDQFQQIIDMENPDLFRWLTGQESVPDTIENPLLRRLCTDLKQTVEPKLTVQSTAAFEGKTWE
jgi:succinate dehydrogenase assembly factor 2